MHPVLENIQRVVQEIKDDQAPLEYARAMAVGVGTDSPGEDDPGAIALVYQGQLFNLSISDAYTTIPPKEAGVLLNAVVLNAFRVWESEFARLLEYAKGVMAERGGADGARALREEAETEGPMSPA